MTHEKMFPILLGHEGTAAPCPSAIPWDAIAPYEGHALANHQQTLERLAQRGGLGPEEAYLVMTGRRGKREMFTKAFEIEACNFLDKIVRDHGELQRQLAVATLEIGDLKDALERARTYTGLEAQGCPLCTYVEGVFTASCSFHQKLAAADLQIHELAEALKGAALIEKGSSLCWCAEVPHSEDCLRARAALAPKPVAATPASDCICGPNFPNHLTNCAEYGKKPKEACTMNCLNRWPDMGHHPECPVRKCAKHGLTVCDECAGKSKCEVKSQAGFPCCLEPGHTGAHQMIVGHNS